MKLDFTKLQTGITSAPLDPRKLFTTLPRTARFKRPLDEQADVLDAWFAKRTQRDVTIKMNTGAGKTLVGLLILQSALNEGVSPAVYITPDNHLTSQVLKEAKDLGIPVTEDDHDSLFLSGKSILVIVVHKLFNGLSRFGVEATKIPIGAEGLRSAPFPTFPPPSTPAAPLLHLALHPLRAYPQTMPYY